MFSLMIQKLKRKKWLVLCMLIGNILLIAVAVSHPMYRVSSFQRMITDDFDKYYEENGKWPAVFTASKSLIKGISKDSLVEMGEDFDRALDTIGIPVKQMITFYQLSTEKAIPSVVRDGKEEKRMNLTAMSGMEEKVEIVHGRLPKTEKTQDGYYEVMVSEAGMVYMDLLLEETYTFGKTKDADGNEVKIKVVGVFEPKDESDIYWMRSISEMQSDVYMNMDSFQKALVANGAEKKNGLTGRWYACWDYKKIAVSEVSSYMNSYHKVLQWDLLKSVAEAETFEEIIEEYSAKAKKTEVTLVILQVPVLLLLCAFLFMISGQMLQMERNEISLLKSRGAKKGQILRLYFMQSVFLAGISVLFGIPLGWAMCRLLGSSTAFLQFSSTRALQIYITSDVGVYAVAAVLVSVFMTTVPVMKYSDISIVNLKQGKAGKHKSVWKKMYLDIICLGISLYGYYTYQRDAENMVENVISGKGLDPLLYISFSLFVLGLGLFVCRIHPLLMKFIYKVSAKWLPPTGYASMLETIRTGYKQEFIIIFMMLTVAIGITDTTIARTIISNATENIQHLNGAQLVVSEEWVNNGALVTTGTADSLIFEEPDFTKYQSIEGVETATKVLYEDVTVKDMDGTDISLMGIQTKGFAEVTAMRKDLLPYDYYDYLNVLASDRDGILVSENFMINQGYRLGDTLTVKDEDGNRFTGNIRGFFTYWPGYAPQEYELSDAGKVDMLERYLVVGNLYGIQNATGLRPYDVWLKTGDGGDGVYRWLEENPNVVLEGFTDTQKSIDEMVESTLFQGTNGILSMSFIVILALCFVGYLIYWIMSIKSRELLFGVLRAMGMRKAEIIRMLILEQICSGIYAIAAGAGIGILSSRMFVPMIQSAYAATDQVLPLELITNQRDLVQLFGVIGVVLCICLIVLGRIISKMNISSALKLGED